MNDSSKPALIVHESYPDKSRLFPTYRHGRVKFIHESCLSLFRRLLGQPGEQEKDAAKAPQLLRLLLQRRVFSSLEEVERRTEKRNMWVKWSTGGEIHYAGPVAFEP
jgi:hypothetical protein